MYQSTEYGRTRQDLVRAEPMFAVCNMQYNLLYHNKGNAQREAKYEKDASFRCISSCFRWP